MPMITICTQVYNTSKYLAQCIESVLNQTYREFEFIVVDNGCTDGSQDILKRYAEKDPRITLIRFEENKLAPRALTCAYKYGTGTYLTNLDSDDWWEPDYLERLLLFSEANDLDIACTGTAMHLPSGGQGFRKIKNELVISGTLFTDALPNYHAFFRTTWNKLIRMHCARSVDLHLIPDLVYGIDTAYCFQLLRFAKQIGIDNSVLHHYRVHAQSMSYAYNAKRFEADVYLYNDAIDFLTSFGSVSTQNRQFLQCVYSNAVFDTSQVIHSSSLSPLEKLREYRTIAAHPLTQAAYRQCQDESAHRSHDALVNLVLLAGKNLCESPDVDLRTSMQVLLPRCGLAVTGKNLPLFFQDDSLFRALQMDDSEMMLRRLLELIEKNQYIKKYNLIGMVQSVAANNLFLCQITDIAFLRRYRDVYLTVWSGKYQQALDEMAGLLLADRVTGGKEAFLNLFISLAAVLEQAPAFVFGKFQLAELLLRQGRLADCQAIIRDMEDMGMSDSEELLSLRRMLDTASKRNSK